ncbi:MAG: sugar kinase [Phenylobacterium sp.]
MAGVLALGECMVELSLAGAGAARVGYAGDTFNTAVYLRRLGRAVSYATALGGDDPFSRGIAELMAAEGIDASLVVRAPDRVPGLYAIERDAAGERRFFYWRDQAPVRDFFTLADKDSLRAAMRAAELIYFSAITLAVIGEAGRASLVALLGEAGDTAVAFDTNYRARLWPGADAARAAIEAVVPHCRYISTSEPDLETLYAEPMEATAARWAQAGAEVVARREDRQVSVLGADGPFTLPATPGVKATDTTGAGDSFNAGYLAARLAGREPTAAVEAGRRLSAVVVQHVGAIIPPGAMPELGGG